MNNYNYAMFPSAPNTLDFYKTGHQDQYPEGTTRVVSNFTARSNKHANVPGDSVVFVGLQYFIREYIEKAWNKWFQLPEDVALGHYRERMDGSLGPGRASIEHLRALHRLRYLPIEIRALPEGTHVPLNVPMLTIHNTDPNFSWLPNFLETALSSYLWMPCTSATTARAYRKLLDKFCELTGSPEDFTPFQGHDFSARGMAGPHAAAMSGMGHLTFFKGTDTVLAIDLVEDNYLTDKDYLIGGSVAATEHSVMCMGGDGEDEIDTFRRLITEIYPDGIVSIVSDTWDFWKVIGEYADILKTDILGRDGKVVFRPDSGDPADILCGSKIPTIKADTYEMFVVEASEIIEDDVRDNTPHGECGPDYEKQLFRWNGDVYEVSVDFYWNRHDKMYYYIDGADTSLVDKVTLTPEQKGAVEVLWDLFGGTETDTGYKLLDSHVGLIYGDSITYERAQDILKRLADKGFASANVVFGIGSYTYQMVTRDTWGMAMKATYGEIRGIPKDIYKDPVTDSGLKKSHKGLLFVDDELNLTQGVDWDKFTSLENALRVVWHNGTFTRLTNFKTVRENAIKGITND